MARTKSTVSWKPGQKEKKIKKLTKQYKLAGMNVIYNVKNIEFILKNKQQILDKKIISNENFLKLETEYQILNEKKKFKSPDQHFIDWQIKRITKRVCQTYPRLKSDYEKRYEIEKNNFDRLSSIFNKTWNHVFQKTIEILKSSYGIVDDHEEDDIDDVSDDVSDDDDDADDDADSI